MDATAADPRPLWELSGLTPPPQLLLEGVHLSPGEASALAARGLLHPLLPGLWSAAAPTPWLRAWAAGLHLRPGSREDYVVSGLGAAWVHGAGAAGRTLEVSAARGARRLNPLELRHLHRRYDAHSPWEDQHLGPVRVSTALRTAVDLARRPQTPRVRHGLAALLLRPDLGLHPDVVAAALRAKPRVVARQRALAAVREALGSAPSRADEDPEAGPGADPRRGPVQAAAGLDPVMR